LLWSKVLFRRIEGINWAEGGSKRGAEKDAWIKDRERNRTLKRKLIMSNCVTLTLHNFLFRQLNQRGGNE